MVIRSALFNILFYLSLILLLICAIPCFLLPRGAILWFARLWARISSALLRFVVGTRIEIRGGENIPEGGFIVAGKHQSLWETFALFLVFRDPVFVFKRQLGQIPFFGWYMLKLGMIAIDRKRGKSALNQISDAAGPLIAEGRQLMIFPEGTRKAVGAPPDYKYGVVHLYNKLDCPVVPVSHISGLYWPRRGFMRNPGTLVLQILPPIEPGLDPKVFAERLQTVIEDTSNALLVEAVARDHPPLTDLARARLDSLNGTASAAAQ